MKTPFNWVGNKYSYMNIVNEIVKDKEYNRVIDMFMGSGNVIMNMKCKADIFIGNDKERLLPMMFDAIRNSSGMFDMVEINLIIEKWNRFSKKEDYYDFRDYWNIKYKRNQFDREFIYETALLLKMCSNSMVRFNKKGEFNQGVRGLGKKDEFFTDSMIKLIIDGPNQLDEELSCKEYKFINSDMVNIEYTENDLLILDPPYILRQDMYSQDFTLKHDDHLLDILNNKKVDFIYFNYIERDNFAHSKLYDILNYNPDLRIIEISNKTKSGQGATGVKDVKEILITNIGE